MIKGQCLCGAHRFELEGPLEMVHHCHCGYCRKHHGAAFATMVGVAAERLEWTRGEIIAYRSSPDFVRESCGICGTPLPQNIPDLPMFVPAGCLEDFAERAEFHLFAASTPSWHEIADGVPAFDAYPPGVGMEPQADCSSDRSGDGVGGSCLCGDVRYVIDDGPVLAARHCHCLRCRRARGAAHASNLVVPENSLSFTAGQEEIRSFKLPEATHFTQCFCGRCGAKVPTVDPGREIAIVPMGGLDDPPPRSPQEHIWTAEIPSWSGVYDSLPQRVGPPE